MNQIQKQPKTTTRRNPATIVDRRSPSGKTEHKNRNA